MASLPWRTAWSAARSCSVAGRSGRRRRPGPAPRRRPATASDSRPGAVPAPSRRRRWAVPAAARPRRPGRGAKPQPSAGLPPVGGTEHRFPGAARPRPPHPPRLRRGRRRPPGLPGAVAPPSRRCLRDVEIAAHLLQPDAQAPLHGTQRYAQLARDLVLRVATEIGQQDRAALVGRQLLQGLAYLLALHVLACQFPGVRAVGRQYRLLDVLLAVLAQRAPPQV